MRLASGVDDDQNQCTHSPPIGTKGVTIQETSFCRFASAQYLAHMSVRRIIGQDENQKASLRIQQWRVQKIESACRKHYA